MVEYRAPIVVVVGHVDVGKTLLLDKIRNTAVAYREPGMITQHIGLSYLPWPAIERYAASLLAKFKLSGKIWVRGGFLMVDTPGHAAFSNLRRREDPWPTWLYWSSMHWREWRSKPRRASSC